MTPEGTLTGRDYVPAGKELNTVTEVFQKIGQKMPNYECREQQINLGECIQYCFKVGKSGVFEAGTGTGKSLAALVPALLTGKKVVVSTATISLQEQYITKDLPTLKGIIPRDFTFTLMKGRGNYVGLRRFQDHLKEEEVDEELVYWVDNTGTGDISDLDFMPHYETWQEINSNKDDCFKNKCPLFKDCFYFEARRFAEKADILVVNHALLLADAASQGNILPKYDYLIVDEAHHLRDIATEAFSSQISAFGIKRLASRASKKVGAPIVLVDNVRRDSEYFFQFLNDGMESKKLRFKSAIEEAKPLLDSLEELKIWLEKQTFEDMLDIELAREKAMLKAKALMSTIDGYMHCLSLIYQPSMDWVVWAEKPDFISEKLKVTAAPLDVAPHLRENLLNKNGLQSTIFMSATLATDSEDPFSYFKSNVGIDGNLVQDKFSSPFNFKDHSMLYLPKGLPNPNSKEYLNQITGKIEDILDVSQGRAFVLFTSKYALNRVYEAVAYKLPYEAKRQGELPRIKLIEWFKKTPNAVLFGTSSFWEGVSVDGQQLSCVIIDRIPFQVPDDPVYEARCEKIQSDDEKNWFIDFALPHAITRLKQGVGRLIRTEDDTGVVAILDPRVTEKFYGKRMIKCMPPMTVSHSFEAIEEFFKKTSSQ